ncbi:MAG TPA: PepSY-associated TM helix domain-containing protein [Thermoanaerobaculia bacterium]|nr:PepSY-associated TM helix domain-containing protein [Thermoanaerobaculia bacterium]
MNLRKIFFWLHLAAGVTAGAVILLMSVTGVLLAFERQVVAYAERDLRASAEQAALAPLPLSQLVAAASAEAGATASNVVVRADRLAPVAVAFGRERTLFVNPYSGAVLGEGARGVRWFFEGNKSLHRWLAMKGEGRERGKAVTGAANLAFLFIVLSGLVIWIPRRRTRTGFRNALFFRRGLRGRARDFNWHHVLGIWAFVPLVAIVFSAVVISYPWATRLVYRAFGSTPPQQQQQQANERPGGKVDLAALDRLWPAARNEAAGVAPRWQSISIRLPFSRKGPATFALDEGNGARPDKRSQLLLDPRSGRLEEHKTYGQQEAGQQARAWLRWIHTGEAGGIAGQFVAMLASAAAVVLVWTGIALALRRFARALRGAPEPSQQLVEEESNA